MPFHPPLLYLYLQEIALALLARLLPKPDKAPRAARPIAGLCIAIALLCVGELFIPIAYRLGWMNFSYGRLGFPGPMRVVAILQTLLLWPLVVFGREEARNRLLSGRRSLGAMLRTGIGLAILGLFATILRAAPGHRILTFAVDLFASVGATALLVLSGSRWISGAYASGTLYLHTVGIVDADSRFDSMGQYVTSGHALYVLELVLVALPVLLVVQLARRRRLDS